MNIFRELVEELKEENLLERTVIDPVDEAKENVDDRNPATASIGSDMQSGQKIENGNGGTSHGLTESAAIDAGNVQNGTKVPSQPETGVAQESTFSSEAPASESVVDSELASEAVDGPAPDSIEEPEKGRSPEEEKKFYRQRAMDEVTGLQLVEHVLSGVEREQMKSSPKTFDDLAVKRSLHEFLKVADDINSPEHAKAEFQLMQETENWCSALSRRDRNISVAHIRRYCETTKPNLSSQALISLARFYRNSPYSEAVRSKFDLVFTKLFSKEQGGELRTVVFKNSELVKHVQELYADWSSIPLYSTEEDDSELLLVALKFQDFINEANTAESFDELVRKDFFKRLKIFKEKTNENFFAPLVVSAAIESNVAVGNRYVELIELERQKSAGSEFGNKYGVDHDNAISDATSKTLELLDILQSEKLETGVSPDFEQEPVNKIVKEPVETGEDSKLKKFTVVGGANKWLIIATVIMVLVTAWIFMQGSTATVPDASEAATAASDFDISGTFLNEYIHSARITRSTMFGVTRESWDVLTSEEKRAIVQKAVALGDANDFKKIHFLNSEGKSIAFGSSEKVMIY